MTGRNPPSERSKDTRTDAEIAELMVWADRRVKLNLQYGPTHPLYKPPPCGAMNGTMDAGAMNTAAPANGNTGNVAGSPASETPDLAEQLQQLLMQITELTARLKTGNGASVVPTSATAIGVHTDTGAPPPTIAATERAVADRSGPGVVEPTINGTINGTPSPSMVMPSQATASFERPPPFAASDSGPFECLNLANGKLLSYSKQSVPDPPSISFSKDLRLMMRIWDNNAPKWTPSEAVLHLQGEPIALKHWRDLYRYGKPRQWKGTKKHWSNWRDIAASWQMLTEAGFWRKFSTEKGPKSYTDICCALKAERKVANRRDAEKARNVYSDGFVSAFAYRRGGQHFVKSSDAAIARQFCSLQDPGLE
ncbi:hypothetical protein EI94DRAFT_1758942 [Lactarius quietus]|nr:hypothetical protein EI94DRAFT_1758942 [Lactarius quietus]